MATQADTNRHRRAAPYDADLGSARHRQVLAAAMRRAGTLETGWLCLAVGAADAAGAVTQRPIPHER